MASYQAGFNAKGKINSQPYAMASYSCREIQPDLDVTNTEGIPGNPNVTTPTIGADACIAGTYHMEAQVRSACFDASSNPFGTPIDLDTGFFALRIYLNGSAGVSWNAPSFYIREVSSEMEVHGVQPVSFQGRTDGAHTVPSS